MKKILLFLTVLGMAAHLSAAAGPLMLYAAPEAIGNGAGTSAATAADIRNEAFWQIVRTELKRTPVVVNLLPGEYIVSYDFNGSAPSDSINLNAIGDEQNLLTIRGAGNNATIFKRNDNDSLEIDGRNFVNLLTLRNCRNILIEDLYFTGKGICGYALQIRGSQYITVRNCHWKNMTGISYGASGANGRVSGNTEQVVCSDILWENCTFDTVGYDSHAHMLYNANGCSNLTMRNCIFTDSTGDYIRFRNGGRNILVENCTFTDTGKYQKIAPFISAPIFVSSEEPRHQEIFAADFVIRNNTFKFARKGPRNWLFLLHISGLDPVGKNYLLTAAESARLTRQAPAAARASFLKRTGVDLGKIVLQNNRISGHSDIAVYECWPHRSLRETFPRTLTPLTRLITIKRGK